MNGTAQEVLRFIKENDVQFIRLSFCDILGTQKNISVMADELEAAFEYGVSFDACAIRGFRDVTQSDLLLFPDPATLSMLPWRPEPGRVARFYCDIKTPGGAAFLHDGRAILKKTEGHAQRMGYRCKVGTECEFYLFKADDNGEPTGETLDSGGYLDMAPLDRGENIRRELCLTLAQMGIHPESSHHEQGPGQNEIDFRFSDALAAADHLQTFKTVVKAVAARNGLFASFLPKPIAQRPGSGLHVNLSLAQNGQNLFASHPEQPHSPAAEYFIAGILARTREISLFLNPLANSYERLGCFEAPRYVSWSHQNRSQLIRIPAAAGEKARMELRSPDPALNPYLAFSLILSAGLEGIAQQLPLPPAVAADLYTAGQDITGQLERLPMDLQEAIDLAQRSDFVRRVLGEEVLACFLAVKRQEAQAFAAAEHPEVFCREQFFKVV